METVIILENLAYSRYRLKELLIENEIKVIEASNSFDFFNRLYENKGSIDLIILEVNLYGEDGFGVIKKIKDKNIDIPVMVLTTENKRKSFIKCVKNGAVDYILKPYNSDMLVNRIVKCIRSGGKWGGAQEETIFVHFRDYLDEEMKKAKKGKYEISILIAALVKTKKYFISYISQFFFLILNDLIYREVEKLFPKPQLFAKLGFTTFIGVMPKSSKEEAELVKENILKIYDELKMIDERLKKYSIEQVIVSYPEDGEQREMLLNRGEELLKEKLDEIE
ncbi:transcriptional regulator [Clostridium tetanomorphum DSM 665]|nr:transcriptional regulator [Clostridium tetanomorphum DSM 665]